VGFEPTIPVLKQEKTVHALDRAVTVIVAMETHVSKYIHLVVHADELLYRRSMGYLNIRRKTQKIPAVTSP
jgi:hypothetical protein